MRLATVAGAASLVRAAAAGMANGNTPSRTLSLSPAAAAEGVLVSEKVVGISSAVPAERVQLTQAALDRVASELTEQLGGDSHSHLFSFGDNGASTKRSTSTGCKTYAGDSSWPSDLLWGIFDALLGKALLDVPPIASVCYDDFDNYNATQCAYVDDEFTDSYLHLEHPSSIMSPFYEGTTCMPTLNGSTSSNCTYGGYPRYVVNATTVAQVQLAVNMARELNLRLVIKNTGHDFAGKSAGEGALSVWTHQLNSIEYLDSYSSGNYTGKALKLGSGAKSEDIYVAANKYGVTVVGGEGATVGMSGGYIQGGGHSPLSGMYGLASDSALAFEVVTADGKFVTASDTENSDLFWALRGGGGSTFGVVTSVTVKAHPSMGVTVSTFTFETGTNVTNETFWQAAYAFWTHMEGYADAGTYAYFRIWALGDPAFYFGMTPWFAPNKTVAEFNALVQPWLDECAALGITIDTNATYYDNFYDGWLNSFPLESVGGAYGRVGSRLWPRDNWANATVMNETIAAVRNVTENGYYFTAFNMKNELHPDNTASSANPHWRPSIMHSILSFTWDEGASVADVLEMSNQFTYGCMDQIRAVTPGSGSYLGESDSSEPNWQTSFFGDNYDRLLELKSKWDPNDVFYAHNAVGSESWTVETSSGLPTQNGKLCKVSS